MARPNGRGGWELTDEDVAQVRAASFGEEARPILTLTDFLLARIAEDEAAASNVSVFVGPGPDFRPQYRGVRDRVLAECTMKRQLIEWAQAIEDLLEIDGWEYTDAPDAAEAILRTLASVYAGHPDYQQEWRP